MKFLKSIIFAILRFEARLILAKYKPFVVAVTGSVGKTSTKDAIFSVLKDHGRYVRKSDKSMNSDPGLPLTIIGAPNAWHSASGWIRNIITGVSLIMKKHEYPELLILEIGADHPNDIKRMAKWLHPDVSIITQVSDLPVHVEFFSSPEEVLEEKASLATAVKKGGTLILFADNEKVLSLQDRVKDKGVKIISFGTADKAEVKGGDYQTVYTLNESPAGDPTPQFSNPKSPTGFKFQLTLNGSTQAVSVPGILGKTYMYPLLAAAAVGLARSLPLSSIITGLNSFDAPKGRMRLHEGRNGSTLIDDSYNSSPDAVLSALNTLRELECSGSKIALLGDMMELGQYSAEEHRNIGREVVGAAVELITIGQRSRTTAAEAVKSGFATSKVHSFDTSVEAGDYLRTIMKSGDIVLIKGSQSIRMERTVAMVMEHPEQAGNVLVRQEKEWLDKK